MLFAHNGESKDDSHIQQKPSQRAYSNGGVAWYDEMTNYERDLINRFCHKK